MLVLGQVFLVDNDFVDVFLEPVVAHDEEALFPGLVAPGVFYLPLADVALVFINPDQGHGMGNFTSAGSQAVSLGQVAVDVQKLVIAARLVAYEDKSPDAIKELDAAVEAFADRVPWDHDPNDEGVEP